MQNKKPTLSKLELKKLTKLSLSTKMAFIESQLQDKILESTLKDEIILKFKLDIYKKLAEEKKKNLENARKEHSKLIASVAKKYNLEGSIEYDPNTGEILK